MTTLLLLALVAWSQEPPVDAPEAPRFLGVGLQFGANTNDPFLERRLVGVEVEWHASRLLSVAGAGSYLPYYDTRDWKLITHQLVGDLRVSPDLSPMIADARVALRFTPIHGAFAFHGEPMELQIYGAVGAGVVATVEDLVALQAEGEPECEATRSQTHPTLHLAWGARLFVWEGLAVHLEHRRQSYVETVCSTIVERKNPIFLQFGASWHFGGSP